MAAAMLLISRRAGVLANNSRSTWPYVVDKPLNQTEPSPAFFIHSGDLLAAVAARPDWTRTTSLVEPVTMLHGPKIFVARSFCGPQAEALARCSQGLAAKRISIANVSTRTLRFRVPY